MSEEEKKALGYFKALDKLTFEPYLSILLKLVNKQQKEIEELKEDREKVIEIITDTKDNLEEMFIKLIKLFKIPKEKVKTNCISKDKIRALIEELEDVLDLAESEKRFPKYRKQALIEEINDLQELLEE